MDVTVTTSKNDSSEKEGEHKNAKTNAIWPSRLHLSISFEGDGQGSVPLDETNLIWQCVLHVLQGEQKKQPRLLQKRDYTQTVEMVVKNEVRKSLLTLSLTLADSRKNNCVGTARKGIRQQRMRDSSWGHDSE